MGWSVRHHKRSAAQALLREKAFDPRKLTEEQKVFDAEEKPAAPKADPPGSKSALRRLCRRARMADPGCGSAVTAPCNPHESALKAENCARRAVGAEHGAHIAEVTRGWLGRDERERSHWTGIHERC
jgi:hypothetical protein